MDLLTPVFKNKVALVVQNSRNPPLQLTCLCIVCCPNNYCRWCVQNRPQLAKMDSCLTHFFSGTALYSDVFLIVCLAIQAYGLLVYEIHFKELTFDCTSLTFSSNHCRNVKVYCCVGCMFHPMLRYAMQSNAFWFGSKLWSCCTCLQGGCL